MCGVCGGVRVMKGLRDEAERRGSRHEPPGRDVAVRGSGEGGDEGGGGREG